jgi:hypothetical protein
MSFLKTGLKMLVLVVFQLLVVSVITSGELIAQPGLPSGPTQVPIDGGLGWLMAAGGWYAYRKLKKEE